MKADSLREKIFDGPHVWCFKDRLEWREADDECVRSGKGRL